jgi:hypothetical protein
MELVVCGGPEFFAPKSVRQETEILFCYGVETSPRQFPTGHRRLHQAQLVDYHPAGEPSEALDSESFFSKIRHSIAGGEGVLVPYASELMSAYPVSLRVNVLGFKPGSEGRMPDLRFTSKPGRCQSQFQADWTEAQDGSAGTRSTVLASPIPDNILALSHPCRLR